MSHHSSLALTSRLTRLIKLLGLIGLISVSLSACSSAPKKFDASALRSRAARATESVSSPKKSPSRATSNAQTSAERAADDQTSAVTQRGAQAPASEGCQEVSCLDQSALSVAEGLGSSVQEARADALAQLSSRIKSEVTSVVKTRYSEGSQSASQSESSIDRTVSTSFRYGELVTYLEPKTRDGQVSVVAYFKKADYQAKLKREYGQALEDVRFQLRDATAPNATPELFVQAWRAIERPLPRYQAYVSEHMAVMGELPPGGQETEELLKMAYTKRRALLSRAQVVILVEGEGSAELGAPLASALQSLLSRWQVRSRLGEVCPQGGWLLKVKTTLNKSVHSLTGMGLERLNATSALHACPQQQLVSQGSLPELRGAERYNKPARVALVENLKALRERAQEGAIEAEGEAKGLAKTTQELHNGLKSVLVDALPL